MDGSLVVLIVDDQPRARRSMRALLATWPRIGDVTEAASGREALEELDAIHPDLVVMDVQMPGMDGLVCARRMRERRPDLKIVLLSMYPEYANEALSAGANDFLVKGEPPRLLLERLAAVTADL